METNVDMRKCSITVILQFVLCILKECHCRALALFSNKERIQRHTRRRGFMTNGCISTFTLCFSDFRGYSQDNATDLFNLALQCRVSVWWAMRLLCLQLLSNVLQGEKKARFYWNDLAEHVGNTLTCWHHLLILFHCQ